MNSYDYASRAVFFGYVGILVCLLIMAANV